MGSGFGLLASSILDFDCYDRLNEIKCPVLVLGGEQDKITTGDTAWMRDSGIPLIEELYSKMNSQGLKGMTIVDYTRIPYIYGPGNVRVTLDFDIRTGLGSTDFLNPDCVTVPAGDAPIILEVKWDAYLPDVIRDAVQLESRRVSAFSKYAQCRVYG